MTRDTNNISDEFWNYVEGRRTETKLWERVYQWLNHDNLGAIMVNGSVYYIETTLSSIPVPAYVNLAIKNFCKTKGLTYLYDIKTTF